MIVDAASIRSGSVLNARFCIIGTGMGGSSVAKKLVEAGQDVLMLEAGGVREANSSQPPPIQAEHVGRSFVLPITRSVELGGTSNYWHGICAPLDPIDFEHRPSIPDSGWPITPADLADFYTQAATLHGVPDTHNFYVTELPADRRERLSDIDFNHAVLENKLVQFRNPPLRWKKLLQQWADQGKIRCLVNATALELICDESGTVTEVVAGSGDARFSVKADFFIVSAGALESARLLLNSKQRLPNGIGNTHDRVGRFLLDHPIGHFCKIGFEHSTQAPLYATAKLDHGIAMMAGLRLTDAQQRETGLPNHYLWLRPSVTPNRINDELLLSFLRARRALDLTFRQIMGILTNRDIFYRVVVHHFGLHPKYRFGDLFFMTEQLPNPNSCVRLSDKHRDRHGYPIAQIDWQLNRADFDSFAQFADLLLREGLCSNQYKIARKDGSEVWERTIASGAHHLGTLRMASAPQSGVVDANLQVFGTRNLFVCDGSVFPTAGSVNPSLTITALGLRLGDRLVRLATSTPVDHSQSVQPAFAD